MPNLFSTLFDNFRAAPVFRPPFEASDNPKASFKAKIQKSLGVHEILVRKNWVSPLPKSQNEEKLYKSVENSSKLTLFRGGGERNFMDKNDFMDIWAFLKNSK